MNKYVVDLSTDSQYHAGSKARADINTILQEDGYTLLALSQEVAPSGICVVDKVRNKTVRKLRQIGTMFRRQLQDKMRQVEEGSIVILQYPFYPQYCNQDIVETIRYACTQKHATFVILVHDMDSLRDTTGKASLRDELQLVGGADAIIVHNSSMQERVTSLDANLARRLYPLQLFDYLVSDTFHAEQARFARKVTIAGNLSYEKTQYVYQLSELHLQNIEVDLYGVNYTGAAEGAIRYKGVFASEEIPFCEGFGLVWDGESIETCAGPTGEYTRINNPHKLSLYMAAGIPVIVWRQAAIARFVEENHVGICVDSLYEIDERIGNMSEETYREMADHVAVISERVRNGWYTKAVCDRIYNTFVAGERL